jgi:hypothetical protein
VGLSVRAKSAVVLLILGLQGAAHAAPEPTAPAPAPAPASAPAPILVDLGVGTYFPVSLGAEATLELPARILVQADLGFMPSPYSNTVVDLMGDFGVLSSFESNLLKLAVQNSLVARLAAGWRPFSKLGFEALVGYTLVTIGGGVSGSDVVQAYLESRGSADRVPAGTGQEVPLDATLHNFQATLGWRFLLLHDKVVLFASVSYLQCFASSIGVSLSPSRPGAQGVINKINSDIEGYLNPYFTEYVKVPVVGLTAAYRF